MFRWLTGRSARQAGPRKNQWRGPRAQHSNHQRSELRWARVRAQCKRGLRWGGVALALVAGGWGAVTAVRHSGPTLQRLFEIRQVTVEGARHVTTQDVIDQLRLPEGIALHQVSPAELVLRAKAHPWVKEAVVTRVPLHELRVSVVERKPAAVIQTDSENFLADEEGRLLASLGRDDDHTLPVLTGVNLEAFFQGEAETRRTIAAGIDLARLVGHTYEGRLAVNAEHPATLVASMRGVQFQFGAAGIAEQWERFQRVKPSIKALRIDGRGRGANEVDLRYDNRVIVRERG